MDWDKLMNTPFLLPTITNDRNFISVFSEEMFDSSIRGGMVLTDQISAVNLRLRKSAVGYSSNWHVAGDPTLIIINKGTLRIIMRDETYKDFSAGNSFIAKDYLPDFVTFDPDIHGHRAEVIGEEALEAVHIKLYQRG